MEVDEIIDAINSFAVKLFVRHGGQVEPANPTVLSENLLKIRGMLLQLVDKVADADLDYRRSKASKFDQLIKDGTKRSPAFDLLDVDKELIEKKIATERLRNYMKYIDGLCSSIQSVLKVQIGSDKHQY